MSPPCARRPKPSREARMRFRYDKSSKWRIGHLAAVPRWQTGGDLRPGCQLRTVADGRESGEVANSRRGYASTDCGIRTSVAGASSPPVQGSGELACDRPL